MRHPLQLGGHVFAAVDIETTGLIPGWHEIVQIAVVLCDDSLRPRTDIEPFTYKLRPLFPERASPDAMAVNGLSLEELDRTAPESATVAQRLSDYVKALELPVNRALVPLAHNWAFESAFMNAWLGLNHFQQVWYRRARDSMTYAAGICDREEFAGRKRPFEQFSLGWLCSHFGIVNEKAHDALADTMATIELYSKLLEWDAAQQVTVSYTPPSLSQNEQRVDYFPSLPNSVPFPNEFVVPFWPSQPPMHFGPAIITNI